MLTAHAAAALLDGLAGTAPLATLLPPLGFPAPRRLDRVSRDRLGLTDSPWAAALAINGTRRALLLETADGPALRERLPALARTLARQQAASEWLLLARHAGTRECAVAAPDASGRGPLPALLVSLDALRPSDAETLAALAAAAAGGDALTHHRWRECLGRDALTARFYRDLEGIVARLGDGAEGRADAESRRIAALLTTSRLLFLAFLEAKGWLDHDRAFLRHQVARVGGALHARLLDPLMFGTLNTPVPRRAAAARAFGAVPFLNGGLFARSPLEGPAGALRLPDEAIAAFVCDLLPRYRLTMREQATTLSEAAVDPEMLGRAFESLMGSARRRAHGAFYTPPTILSRVAERGLAALPADPLVFPRILDPACGSGAFLVHALEWLSRRRMAAGDDRPSTTVRREVLCRSLFGVDRDPIAVWLCQLRLWLALVVDDERTDLTALPPLPNLDRNVRQGDALAGPAFGTTRRDVGDAAPHDAADRAGGARIGCGPALTGLRLRYARASGARKRTLARMLDRAERQAARLAAQARLDAATHARRERLLAARGPDLFRRRHGVDAAGRAALATLRDAVRTARAELRALRTGAGTPFAFATHFPEAARTGGFDLVIGNPPWVRPHALPPVEREALRARFETGRAAAWETGATAAGAGRGFASQVDLASLFVERSVQLVRPGGHVALLLPAKLWRSLAGGGVRAFLTREAPPLALDIWEDDAAGFDAAVYPAALLARRTDDPPPRISCARRHGAQETTWSLARPALTLDASVGAPWLTLPPDVRAAFDRLRAAGIPLATSALGRPTLGVKTGCNAAFVVTPGALTAPDLVAVRSGEAHGAVERAMLRPVLRGETLHAREVATGESVVWTHDVAGRPLATLPPRARRWLERWRTPLERRTDRASAWWALFRTESAATDRARVVWADIGRTPRARVLPAGDPHVPLNSCYVVRTRDETDAHALAALLNAPVMVGWLACLAEPARGGYHRFLGWTCALLPIPREWSRARTILAPIGRAAAMGRPIDATSHDALVADAFGLPLAALAPLRPAG
jgi:SAM-dependent methyltransferase